MKKISVLALMMFVAIAYTFAEEPKAELKITEFTGEASVTIGADLDNSSAAMSNSTTAKLTVELVSGGDKSTTGDEDSIWGDIKIKTDGDPIRAMNEGTLGLTGYTIVIDYAKLHYGKMAYIGVMAPDSSINYAIFADASARYIPVDTAKRYGILLDGYLVGDDNNSAGPEGTGGLTLGLSLEKLFKVDVILDSLNTWTATGTVDDATPDTADLLSADKNRFAFRGTVGLLAVEDLTLEGAFSTGFGGDDYLYDKGFGGKLGYKYRVNETMYLKPNAGIDVALNTADGGSYSTVAGDDNIGIAISAGVLFGWADKAKTPDLYFFRDEDNDQGFYPGVSVNLVHVSSDVFGPARLGLNAGFLSGTLIENLTAAAAFDIVDLTAGDIEMGFASVVKYSMKTEGTLVMAPKAGISLHSDAGAVVDADKTALFIKAGLELNTIFPNTYFSLDYSSNDLIDGVVSINNTNAQKFGSLSTTLKIAF